MKKWSTILWMTWILFYLGGISICFGTEYPITIDRCAIGSDPNQIEITASLTGSISSSQEECFYLFELKPYENELGTRTDYITWVYPNTSFSFSVDLNLNQENSRLYSKFVIAVKSGESYQQVSAPHYLTNPERIALYTYPFPTASTKKGLLMDPERLSEAGELGLSHASYNIPISWFLGETTHTAYPTILYNHHGKIYAINGHIVAEYDNIFRQLTNQGVIITAILLNPYQTTQPQLIHPYSKDSTSAFYYAFNTAEASGVESVEAVASFLAERYSREDKEYGQVMNWVIGNEVNICKEWNYMQDVGIQAYVGEYIKGFRIFYTAIKSKNANARVYISLDQRWNRTDESLDRYYNGKEFLDIWNARILLEGNIDWSLAQHPYTIPLSAPRFWDLPESYQTMNLVQNQEQTPILSIENINVLTDYLQKSEYRNPDGQVRHLIVSELGYSSRSEEGDDLEGQAAAIAYAYHIAKANDYIDSFLLLRQEDTSEELAQGLAFGLYTMDGVRKPAYAVYQSLDTSKEEVYSPFVRGIIGITDWREVITPVKRSCVIGWNYDGRGWWYCQADGMYPVQTWMKLDGAWYYFDAEGYMLSNTMTPDGYFVDENGICSPIG